MELPIPQWLARTSCDVRRSHVCAAAIVEGKRLSAAFYHGDRAMRESGFDTSFRFGSFSGSSADYAPVCLNSLLFKYAKDMESFATLLGKGSAAKHWAELAAARHAAIDKYLWDGEAGLYLDYDFVKSQRSSYKFVATFYPLWAGAAGEAQAAAVRANLPLFERSGGIATSDFASGVQWDLPFGWAPTNWLTASGLEAYGYHDDAARVSAEFSHTVIENFRHDGTMREKYNVADGSANVKVAAGYKSNVVGFGWTNGVYLKMQDLLAGTATSVK